MSDRRKKGPPKLGDLRPSQVITTFGPGAVVDFRNVSAVMAGTDFWRPEPGHEIDEPRLRSLLRVQALYRPPIESDGGIFLPSFLFPQYLRCPRCRRIGRYDRTDLFRFDGQRFRCRARHEVKVAAGGPVVFPARFVIACSDGHLDDFPWGAFVHRGVASAACQPELLTLRESAQSAAISELVVECDCCKKKRSMEDAFGKRAKNALGACPGTRPWLGDQGNETCRSGEVRTTLRGASNLYFSIVQSALSIPEWDNPIHAAIAFHELDLARIDSIAKLKAALELGVFHRLTAFDAEDVFHALQRRRQQADTRPTPLDLRREEFVALTAPPNAGSEDGREFQTEFVDVPARLKGQIERVVIVRRLREVRALNGFTRIDSPFDPLADEDDLERFGVQSLSAAPANWRPAVELRGEGVFVQLRNASVRDWEARKALIDRSDVLRRLHDDWRREHELPQSQYPGARFVLLHSLAHMLIQGLSLDCGYSSSSIRERIYSSSEAEGGMAAVLLYTATPDSDGSLGGLAEKGRSADFERLVTDCLERATYCSSDPLCGHSASGEMGRLNGAACHACLLVSETSCERSNQYLDRAHVVQTVAQLGTNYF